MGRITTPTYRVEYRDNVLPRTQIVESNGQVIARLPTKWESIAWNSKQSGKPTKANLEAWRRKYNESFKRGGVNYHISVMHRTELHITHARIIHQASGQIVATTTMPMFEVV